MKNTERGKVFEREVVDVLRRHGFPDAERVLRMGAHADHGDIAGVPGFYLDCKDHGTFTLAAWMDEVHADAEHASGYFGGLLIPAVVVKRRGKAPARAYVVLELADFTDVVSGGGWGKRANACRRPVRAMRLKPRRARHRQRPICERVDRQPQGRCDRHQPSGLARAAPTVAMPVVPRQTKAWLLMGTTSPLRSEQGQAVSLPTFVMLCLVLVVIVAVIRPPD